MGVTDEDAQMDLDLYIGNFSPEVHLSSQNQIRKNITSAKSILISLFLLDFMESQKKHNTKLTTVTYLARSQVTEKSIGST